MSAPRRRAGVILPLSAVRSGRDWGIGDTAALEGLFAWMRRAKISVLQILPLNDLAPGDSCPYTALSAFALDSAYIALDRVPEIRGSRRLRAELRALSGSRKVRALRDSRRVHFARVRALKHSLLKKAFARFTQPPAYRSFVRRNRGWLMDYALFRALKEELGAISWRSWPEALRDRDPAALKAAYERQHGRVEFFIYLQWLIHSQWGEVRRSAAKAGIRLFGDIPFGLSTESADVWARAEEFDFEASMGAPPDQYSKTGQAWGLPAYRWQRMEEDGHHWWRMRIRQCRGLYHIFRMDHAVGFFRTWLIRRGRRKNGFDVAGVSRQKARGLRFFRMVLQEGSPAQIVAEDLGVIPSFAYEVLGGLRIPGYKVCRWERDAGGFQDPKSFPPLSVATTGNHDTSTLAAWWSELAEGERSLFWRMASGRKERAPRFSPRVRLVLLRCVYGAGSELALFPFQDLFGTRERINTPGTVGSANWTYRMRWPVEKLLSDAALKGWTGRLRELAAASGRT